MTDESLLTLRQLADGLGIPESTVRYYRDNFIDHIPSVGRGRRRRYPQQALAILRSISEAYSSGRSRTEILSSIRNNGTSIVEHAAPAEEVSNLDLLAAIIDGEREQRDALWQMAKEIVRLTEVLSEQDQVISQIAGQTGVQLSLPRAEVRQLPSVTTSVPSQPPSFVPPPPHSPPAPSIDVERLKAELEAERALVEKLRESKLQLEHRAADAEAALEDKKGRRSSVIRRLLGSEEDA